MVDDSLVSGLPTAGRRLIERLPAAGIPVVAAFWGRREANDPWYLYIVTPAVDGVDPRPTYRVLDRVLAELTAAGLESIDWMTVQLVGTDTAAGKAGVAAVGRSAARGRWTPHDVFPHDGSGLTPRYLYAPADG